MASKIKTDDPRHHKYVSVNKTERKKRPTRLVRLASLLFPRWMFCPRGHCRFRYGFEGPCLHKGATVAWDDCNHKTFRLLERRKGQRKGGMAYRKRRTRYGLVEIAHYRRNQPC